MLSRRLLSAEVVYNGLGTARANGAVVVQGEGAEARVIAVDSLERARQNFPDTPEEHIGFAISLPLVNAHTHLDLSLLPWQRSNYTAFIARVIAHAPTRRARGLEAAREGVRQLQEANIHAVGDIVTNEAVMEWLLKRSDLQGVAYWEVIGTDPAQAEAIFNKTVEQLRRFRSWERPGGMRVGLSPHTPHTVSAPLLQKLARLAKHSSLPMQIHVAESAAELALHRDGSGELMDMLQGFLPDWQPSGKTPLGYLADLGVLEAEPSLVHMVHVSEDDIREVQRANCTVVHCPRSNETLDCGRFPWELYMKHGVEVAFGTDSLGSSPSLAIEAEVAAAARLHGDKASPLALVRAAAKGGCRVLDLTPGRFVRADPADRLHFWPRLQE